MAADRETLRRSLPDGRVLLLHDDVARGSWHVVVEGAPGGEVMGAPDLAGVIAEALGYDPAQDEWPRWIGWLADEIEMDWTLRRALDRPVFE